MLVVMISVKKIRRNHYVVETQDLGVTIHLMPYEDLRIAVKADVADKDKNEIENLLTGVSQRCEKIKPFLERRRTSVVADVRQNNHSASTTYDPSPGRRNRSLTTDESPERDLKEDAPASKKRK
jgi:hypothetical protein